MPMDGFNEINALPIFPEALNPLLSQTRTSPNPLGTAGDDAAEGFSATGSYCPVQIGNLLSGGLLPVEWRMRLSGTVARLRHISGKPTPRACRDVLQHNGRLATVPVRECSQSISGFCNKAAPGAGTAAPALFFIPGACRYFLLPLKD